jgi:flagellar hook-associated protein 2
VPVGSANLDVQGIVSQLITLDQRPIVALNTKEAAYQTKISAYGNISGALSSFQTTVQDLSKIEKFQSLKATSSDASIVGVSAAGKAELGNHTMIISSLAQNQKLATQGQLIDTASIGSGEPSKLVIEFGSISGGKLDSSSGKYSGATFTSNGQGSKTLTIDSSNNTLQGIRDSINKAKIGINASIVNDGSGTPYTLTLSSSNIGSSNSIKIAVTGDESINSLLSHDPSNKQNLTQTVAAQNAAFTVDGVSVSKASNTVSDVIPGVTLELLKTTTTPATFTITRDPSGITSSIQNFVKGFNELNKSLQELTAYNPATKQGAVLQGDSTVRLLQSQIRAVLNTSIGNTGGAYNNLSQIGVSLQKDGTMALDTSKLNNAINSYPNDVAALFTTIGSTSDPHLSYTAAGSTTGTYPINVTKLPTKGGIAAREEVETLIIDEGENDSLDVSVDGVSASIVLSPGTYSYDSLAKEVQSKINGAEKLASANHSVSVLHGEDGYIITSNAYGSKSKVDVKGNAALNLLGEKPLLSVGKDVSGTINGAPAIGSGQTLTSDRGAASGLKIIVNGGEVGERGKVNYSQGYAHLLNKLITSVLAKDGQLESKKKGINTSIKDIETHRDTLQQRLPLQEARYRKQYSTLETTLSNLSKTSNYLTQQLSNLPRPY